MIYLEPVPAFTPKQYKSTVNYSGEETMYYFMQATRHFYLLKEGEQVLGLIGLVLPSMLSNRALIWFGPVKGVKFTLRQIREGKALAETFFERMPYSIYAELDTREPATVRFAKFFGLKKHCSKNPIDLYVREK